MVFDIRTVLSRGLSILLLSSTLSILHLWLLTFVEPFLGTRGATVISFGIMGVLLFATPLWSKMRGALDRLILRDRSDDQVRLLNTAHDLVTIPDYEGLLQYTVDVVKNVLSIEHVWLILRDREGALRVQGARRRDGIVDQVMGQSEVIVQHAAKTRRTFVRGSGMRIMADRTASSASQAMAEAGLRIAVPLLYKNDMLGVLALGPRGDGSGFREGDIEALESFAMSVAVAIQNARRYGESMNDRLTQLYHRKYFILLARDVISTARKRRHPLSFLMVGVDRFREVNEQHGHVVGDMVLKEIAAELHRLCRETDILSRYGGDEFAILLPEAKGDAGMMVAERLRSGIEGLKPEGISVTISIGTSSLSADDGEEAEDALIPQAWKALGEAKRQGGNRVL